MKNFEMHDLIRKQSVELSFTLAKWMVNQIIDRLEIMVVFYKGKNKSTDFLNKEYIKLVNSEIISWKNLAERVSKV